MMIIYTELVQGQMPSENLLKYSSTISKNFIYVSYHNSPYCDLYDVSIQKFHGSILLGNLDNDVYTKV